MPKKSKKSKSKRTTLKQKYKVLKKVKEHHRKKAKQLRTSGSKPKAPKDPGIPGQWPFKEQLLKELDWQKRNILAKEQQRKEERRLARVLRLPNPPAATLCRPHCKSALAGLGLCSFQHADPQSCPAEARAAGRWRH